MKCRGDERSTECAQPGGSADGSVDAIRRTMTYVSESPAHCDAFARAPAEVVRMAGTGLPEADLERACRALADILQIAPFDRATHAQRD